MHKFQVEAEVTYSKIYQHTIELEAEDQEEAEAIFTQLFEDGLIPNHVWIDIDTRFESGPDFVTRVFVESKQKWVAPA